MGNGSPSTEILLKIKEEGFGVYCVGNKIHILCETCEYHGREHVVDVRTMGVNCTGCKRRIGVEIPHKLMFLISRTNLATDFLRAKYAS